MAVNWAFLCVFSERFYEFICIFCCRSWMGWLRGDIAELICIFRVRSWSIFRSWRFLNYASNDEFNGWIELRKYSNWINWRCGGWNIDVLRHIQLASGVRRMCGGRGLCRGKPRDCQRTNGAVAGVYRYISPLFVGAAICSVAFIFYLFVTSWISFFFLFFLQVTIIMMLCLFTTAPEIGRCLR